MNGCLGTYPRESMIDRAVSMCCGLSSGPWSPDDTMVSTQRAYSSDRPAGGWEPIRPRSSRAGDAPSLRSPRSHQYGVRADSSRRANAGSGSIARCSAAYRLSCSRSSIRSHWSCPPPRRCGSAVSARRRNTLRAPVAATPPRPRRRAVRRRRPGSCPASCSGRPPPRRATCPPGRSAGRSSSGSPLTCSAASRVAPPAKTVSRLASTRSSSSSRSQLHSTTARSVWCRGCAVRLPRDSSRKRSSSRAAISVDRQRAQPGRGQLDRQRQPVEGLADAQHRPVRGVVHGSPAVRPWPGRRRAGPRVAAPGRRRAAAAAAARRAEASRR